MSKVAAYVMHGNGLAKRVVPLMVQGALRSGDKTTTFRDTDYCAAHTEEYDAAIFWGYVETCQHIMQGYREAGKAAVYLDLAYWKREDYYKVSVGDRHPTAYFQSRKHDCVRRVLFGVKPSQYNHNDGYILLAGMSAKAAWAEKHEPTESWERAAIVEIKKYTDRPIIYRPKPSWSGARPIEGAGYSKSTQVLFSDCYAVVAHHSNVAIDGLINGVPAFVWKGVASPMGLHDLSLINTPLYPEGREQWANDVAYCQWSVDEMRDGTCWRYLKDEGLVLCT